MSNNTASWAEERQTLDKVAAPALGGPDFAIDHYRDDLAELGLTVDQGRELLETLWSIMGYFARLGHSVDVCGLIFSEFNEASSPTDGTARLMHSTNMESASDRTEAAHE
ncbi:MAG: hypothetical protein WBA44_17530 [Mesorhizobium sp.]